MKRKNKPLLSLIGIIVITFIVLLTGSINVQASQDFDITKLECSPSQIEPGESVTIEVEIQGMANKNNNNVLIYVTTPSGERSSTNLKIATGPDGKGSGTVKYPDNFQPAEKASTTALGEYKVEAHYRTARFYCGSFMVIDESPLGTTMPLIAGFMAVAVISLIKKR